METVFEECLDALDCSNSLSVQMDSVHITSHTSEIVPEKPYLEINADQLEQVHTLSDNNSNNTHTNTSCYCDAYGSHKDKTPLKTEVVDGVEGAFIIRSVLTKTECAPLRRAVIDLHAAYQLQSKPRRSSQHHLPARVAQRTLKGLSKRIRHLLPSLAGPNHKGAIEAEGLEISNFLRCYHYKENDFSAPHYDRSFTEHAEIKGPDHGRLLRFSAYSMLVYLNEDFEGGHTTFFEQVNPGLIAKTGFTLADESTRDQLVITGRVAPQEGDVLIFPHGNHKGCYSNPFHEGSRLLRGEKVIIRTDIVYRAPPPKKKYKYQSVNI